jgi:hypothetical protein
VSEILLILSYTILSPLFVVKFRFSAVTKLMSMKLRPLNNCGLNNENVFIKVVSAVIKVNVIFINFVIIKQQNA